MERTDFISTREEVLQNMRTMYSYLNGDSGEDDKRWGIDKMKRGHNYVVEVIDGRLSFCPSRFAGYVDNTRKKHDANHGDGTETDGKLKAFYDKVEDERLDKCLQAVMEQYDCSTGSKKYWIPKGLTIAQLTSGVMPQKPNYWVARLTDDEHWDMAINNHIWLTQQQYGKQDSRSVSNLWGLVSAIKPDDILLLCYHSEIYACGKVVICPFESSQISTIKDVVTQNKHEFDSGIVRFTDSDVFYEDLEKGCQNWGQRIMVEQWEYYSDLTSVRTGGMTNNITQGVTYMSLIGVTESFGEQ